MKKAVTISMAMLLLAAGFVFVSYDDADEGVKLMSEDDYIEITNFESGLVSSTDSEQPQESYIKLEGDYEVVKTEYLK